MSDNFKKTISDEYLKILEAVSEVAIIAYTDKKGRITFANENFCKISGYTFDELFNKDHRLLNSSHHDKKFFREMYEVTQNGKIWRGEIKNKRKDGSFYWVDTQIIPIMDQKGEIESFASIRFDITERKNMEEAIVQIQKLASICELAKAISHDINNPLTIIDLCCKGLNRELNNSIPNIATRKKIFKIMEQSKRISMIIKDLRTFSKPRVEKAKLVA